MSQPTKMARVDWGVPACDLAYQRTKIYNGLALCDVCGERKTDRLVDLPFTNYPTMMPHVCDECIPGFKKRMMIASFTRGAIITEHSWQKTFDMAKLKALRVPRSRGGVSAFVPYSSHSLKLRFGQNQVPQVRCEFEDPAGNGMIKLVRVDKFLVVNRGLPDLVIHAHTLPKEHFDDLSKRLSPLGVRLVRKY